MSIDHNFYMDTTATRHELRDALVEAGIGLETRPDMVGRPDGLPDLSFAASPATSVTILDGRDYSWMPDNGVLPTRRILFSDRGAGQEFEAQTTRGVVALLRAFPDADAYWTAYDAERPVLLRRRGRLVLAQAQTVGGRHWDAERQPYLALMDLPYSVESLGPWEYGPVRAPAAAE